MLSEFQDERGRFKTGNKANPTGRGGFGDNPEHRNPGGWDYETSIPYWFNKFQRMGLSEFEGWLTEHEDEVTPAIKTAWQRVSEMMKNADKSKNALPAADMVMDRTIGKPRVTVDQNVGGQDDNRLVIEFKGNEQD